MIIRFLKRKILRRETLCRNFRCFQNPLQRSSRMRFPTAGVLGRIRSAGVLRISWRQASHVTPAEQSRLAARDSASSHQW